MNFELNEEESQVIVMALFFLTTSHISLKYLDGNIESNNPRLLLIKGLSERLVEVTKVETQEP